jgi:phosphatidylserine/phosphatidylglycerophosphate/cardiolipin synthase-like enzyme
MRLLRYTVTIMLVTRYTNPNEVAQVEATYLSTAKKTIDFAAYSLTHPAIISALLARAQAGVIIRLYLDRSELEAEARGNPALAQSPLSALLNVPNITIKVKDSIILMHMKSYLLDGLTLRDGSANFSPLGEAEQDNSHIITDDFDAVNNFVNKFSSMWARPDNLSVTEAIERGRSYTIHHPGSPAAQPIV